ncbi:MAG: S9 family peptidase, partial [Mariniphaga sp.]
MKKLLSILLIVLMAFVLQAQNGQQITLEDIFTKGTFRAETVRGLHSMNDGEHYTTLEGNTKIVKNSYKTGEVVDILFDLEKIDRAPLASLSDYTFSEDETKILLTTDEKPIYRHSYTAQYYIWNAVTEELIPLSD